MRSVRLLAAPCCLFKKGRLERELAEEIDGHLQRHIEDNLERL